MSLENRKPNWKYSDQRAQSLIDANTQGQTIDARERPSVSMLWLARCYASVFRDEPWRESYKTDTEEFVGAEYDLSWSQLGYQRAYPLKVTSMYIQRELEKLNSRLIVETDNTNPKRVIAFGWGYSLESNEELVSDKWSQASLVQQAELVEAFDRVTQGFQPWYLSEVGVLQKSREKGVASGIVARLLQEAPEDQPVMMRTNALSPMTVIARNLGFEQVLGPVTNRVENQISVSETETVNGVVDPINPQRVVYVRLPRRIS